MSKIEITKFFSEIETTENHSGYFCSVGEALTIVILGSICGLRNVCQIHQWASNSRTKQFLTKHFGINKVPCYYWLLCLLKLIKPKSLNKCFIKWAQSVFMKKGATLSFDGKSIRSTGKMEKYSSTMHIVSAHLAELGITIGQQKVDGKSNEIPAMRELIKLLNIEGCMVVADALNCQKETAKAIVKSGADYLLSVKDNQSELKREIEEYVQDQDLRKAMDKTTTKEKNRGRIETRTAYVLSDINWLWSKKDWMSLSCVGAINTKFETKNGKSNEWHYYISSRNLTPEELLKHARLEWSVESMHWLLDVHFDEDFCRVENENVQQNLNIIRKIALNCCKNYKTNFSSKLPISKIMFECLLDCPSILPLLVPFEN